MHTQFKIHQEHSHLFRDGESLVSLVAFAKQASRQRSAASALKVIEKKHGLKIYLVFVNFLVPPRALENFFLHWPLRLV